MNVTNLPEFSYRAHLFGPFTVLHRDDFLGTGAAPGLAAARTLLKWFLIHPGVRFSVIELADVIAPGAINPRSRLNRTLHYLRDYLEPHRVDRSSRFIHGAGCGYLFEPASAWSVDYWWAKSLINTASRSREAGDLDDAIGDLEKLARLEDKVFLPEEIYDDTFAETRAAQESACKEANRTLLELYLSTRRLPQALAGGLAMLDQDPYAEEAANAVAVAHARGGDRIAAVQSLMEFRTRLGQDLQIRPSGDLRQLEEELRTGAPLTCLAGEPMS